MGSTGERGGPQDGSVAVLCRSRSSSSHSCYGQYTLFCCCEGHIIFHGVTDAWGIWGTPPCGASPCPPFLAAASVSSVMG